MVNSNCGILHRRRPSGARRHESSAELSNRMCMSIGSNRRGGNRYPKDDGGEYEVGRECSEPRGPFSMDGQC